ncbi:hypothetical protein AN901_204649 [Pseudomonas syringae pv. theae]|nr:hypothetical protein AN901_204649 [Pseudomonas syringae pv. theae]
MGPSYSCQIWTVIPIDIHGVHVWIDFQPVSSMEVRQLKCC